MAEKNRCRQYSLSKSFIIKKKRATRGTNRKIFFFFFFFFFNNWRDEYICRGGKLKKPKKGGMVNPRVGVESGGTNLRKKTRHIHPLRNSNKEKQLRCKPE